MTKPIYNTGPYRLTCPRCNGDGAWTEHVEHHSYTQPCDCACLYEEKWIEANVAERFSEQYELFIEEAAMARAGGRSHE